MTNTSHRTVGRADNPTALAAEWILLNSGCEDLMTFEEWCDRKAAAVAYCDTWTEAERTEFFYAVAAQACTEPLLAPSPGLRMTPETMARELRRLERIVFSLYDGGSEHPPYNWIRFTDPLMSGFTVGESWRYAHELTNLAYGLEGRPVVLPSDAAVKLADLYRPQE